MAQEQVLTADPVPAESATEGTSLRRGTDWWGEAKGIFWLILAVLGFHSFIAKPFYIPSESMLPGLEVGDRLVVNKFAYGWSFVSPTIPNPAAIFRSLVLRQPQDSWSVQVPFRSGRILGRMPTRGDVVIVTPPGSNSDYIKRVIGLPGDRLAVHGGVVYLNRVPVKRGPLHYVDLRNYGGVPLPEGRDTCDLGEYGPQVQRRDADGEIACHLPIITETLPNGRTYDTVELGASPGDDYAEITIPANHLFLMGDNRDRSSDSRFHTGGFERGLGGAVPWENIGGRAEFITFSVDGKATWNPLTWWGSLRSGRAGTSLHPEQTR